MIDTNFSDETAWDTFVAAHPAGHVLQSSRWGQLKSRFDWQLARLAVLQHGRVTAGAQLLFRRFPWGQTLGYVPKGPLVDWSDDTQVNMLLEGLRELGRRYQAFAIKVEPDLPDDPVLARRLAALGFHPSQHTVQPRSTIHIDLTLSPEDILARMKSKWRYNVRLSGRKGVIVREGTAADLPAFQALVEATATRNRFGMHQAAYYTAAFELFVPAGQAVWLIAEYEGEPLAAIVPFAFGRKAWYMWGASSNRHRGRMPNHALQWAAIRWAQARGCIIYDLWGIPDEVGQNPEAYAKETPDRRDGLWGVYRFKQGFGGRVVRYVGAWDLVLSPMGYRLYEIALRVRERLRR
ncbi:MAG TPA: peptidoglycan bridge formation glycyltransferase FemA/FemB family protein [Anaerolineae bacterium]|nr:peptidoglycan bridge formation glycyltransferase FemA/FemB family protein [Anaerolineae bacterium]HIQ04137.1 peptidoglycan bridge formation glycyltransferase FemA/FemB family protein [Anaerolineae bacterium]